MGFRNGLSQWIFYGTIALLLAGCGGGGGGTLTAEQQIVASNASFRSRAQTILQGAAQEMGVQVDTQDFAGIVLTNGSDGKRNVVVNTNIRGVQNLTMDNLSRGADVLFCYLQTDDDYRNFFVVNIRNDNGRWVAQIRNLAGDTTTVDAEVTTQARENEKPKLTVDWDGGPCLDARFGPIVIKVCFPIDIKDLIPLRTTSGEWENQMDTAAQQISTSVRGSIGSRSRDSSTGVVIVTREDVVLAAQLLTGTVTTPLASVNGRALAACYIQASNRSDMPSSIFNITLTESGSGSLNASGLPQVPVSVEPANLVIKTKSSPRARLADVDLELLLPIEDRVIALQFPL